MNPTRVFVLLFILLFIFGCAGERKRRAPTYKRPPVLEDQGLKTPERKAAYELVLNGTSSLDKGDPDKAEWYFQEAIRLSPSYGPAYYWLARAKYELDEMKRAWDLLDKAELLIGHDRSWLERIDELRRMVSE